MNVSTIGGALIAALISFMNALLALYMNDPELSFGMISQAAWVGMIGGGLVQFFKDYQALSTRRVISNITGTGEG